MDQVSINYTSIFQCKTLQNLPKIWIFGLKTNHLATLLSMCEDDWKQIGRTEARSERRISLHFLSKYIHTCC
jgi:hypothetical protein